MPRKNDGTAIRICVRQFVSVSTHFPANRALRIPSGTEITVMMSREMTARSTVTGSRCARRERTEVPSYR